ncbi:MAG: hypothetical protein ACI845_001133 [Gammaproteobacteria bacterium]|jgi:hypothetical protein
MAKNQVDNRKLTSKDIVNGLARRDIYDGKGLLLVKKGNRISQAHYDRMREEGLIHEEKSNSPSRAVHDINYVNDNSVHARLLKIVMRYKNLQKSILEQSDDSSGSDLSELAERLIELCEEDVNQILGELFLIGHSHYNVTKPVYIASSLVELVKRFNHYNPSETIDSSKRLALVLAALGFNLGLLQFEKQVLDNQNQFSSDEKRGLEEHYSKESISLLEKAGLNDPTMADAIQHHNIASDNPSRNGLLLRTPFVFADIAMAQASGIGGDSMLNPTREFARMFASKQLDPIFAGLFLKINGIAPIGSILQFESREKAVVIKGPIDKDISSSTIRMLTDRSGIQLRRPGEKSQLNKLPIKHLGLADHHQFSWINFDPHVMWQK